jgi:hypothetical protein
MYSLRACLLMSSCIFAVSTSSSVASAQRINISNTSAPLSRALQDGTSNPGAFNSKPGGSTPLSPPNQAPIPSNSSFQSRASEPTSTAPSAQNTSAGSTSSVPAMVPHPPMSPVLASLVKARDHKRTLSDRAVALVNAQNEISKLPMSEQVAYIELVNASRQRLIVDTYLFDSGQVQNNISAKTK